MKYYSSRTRTLSILWLPILGGFAMLLHFEQHFLFRLRLLFDGNLGFTSNSWESVLMHRAADQSLQGSMNSFFRIIDSSSSVPALDDLEPWLNSFPAASREFRSPKEMLQKRVRKTA